MSVILRLRQYHAVLALLVTAAYISGEWGLVHAWLGYAVALVILVRLIWATTGVRQLGLERFHPVFKGLRLGTALTHPAISRTFLLGIAVCLIGATATGIMMDRGRAVGLAVPAIAAPAYADDHRAHAGKAGRDSKGALNGVHEALANLLFALVLCHITYLLIFKFPLARFMLFLDRPEDRERGTVSNPG